MKKKLNGCASKMILYRPIKKEDVPQIQRLALISWLFAYKNIYSKSSIIKYVSRYYSLKNFKKYFQKKSKDEIFIVAEKNKKIIGYANIGKSKKDRELLRIYVSPNIMGKGIGSSLIKRIEKFLKSKKAKRYIVYPHAKNKIAANFYVKSGFVRFPSKDRGRVSPCYIKHI
jgi:ribosomal protein S18 acetylase RimI-like enzyme